MRQRLDVSSCAGLGWRWETQTVAIQLRERGTIMGWSLTEEHREQSISKYIETEERNAARYENEWESDGFSLGQKKGWLLCPAQEEQSKPLTGVSEDQPNLLPRWLRWVLQWWRYVLRQLQYHFATCPITPHPCSQAEKGSTLMWQEDSQKSPSTQDHPHQERLGTISALPRSPCPPGWRPGVRKHVHQPGFSSAFGEW